MKLKKKIYDHMHDKYINTPQFNKLKAENFVAKLAQADLVTKTDIDNKLSNLNGKITTNKTKNFLVENESKKLETFDSVYFGGKSHFENDSTQHWLVFQPIPRCFKTIIAGNRNILSWKSKRLSDESIKPPTTLNKILNPSLARVKVSRDCLKQEQIIFNYGKIVT